MGRAGRLTGLGICTTFVPVGVRREISAISVFKSPLGHPEWCCITSLQVPLEHADGPADACGLPPALTGPASRHGRQP
jgi:hypothetical protein